MTISRDRKNKNDKRQRPLFESVYEPHESILGHIVDLSHGHHCELSSQEELILSNHLIRAGFIIKAEANHLESPSFAARFT